MKKLALILSLVTLNLVGCGGGGGGSGGTNVSTLSFPLQTGYRSIIINGLQKTFSVSGSCSGTGTKTSAPANTSATFENQQAFSSVGTLTANLSSPCNSIAQSYTSYVDTNYVPLGMNSVGVNYGVYLTPPTLPSSVRVGDTGIIGTENLYTNSSKSVSNGTMVMSYVVTADTANTATVTLISKMYNSSSTLTATEQDVYRIDSTGTLTPISVDILYSNGAHLIFTYN